MLTATRRGLLSLAMFGAALSPQAMAQTNVAFVDTQTAILQTAEIVKEQAGMEAKFKPRQDEIQKLQQELQDSQSKIQTMQGKLTAEALRNLEIQAQRLQRDLQRKTEDLTAEVDNQRNDVLQRVGTRMRVVIQSLAEAKGLDAVIDSSASLYHKPSLDLTKEATAAYDKTHPVQQ